MSDQCLTPSRRAAAIAHMRRLRDIDMKIGIKHSGIALDIGMLFYEHAEGTLCVQDVTAATGYSGPTVRLVLRRLQRAKALALATRQGRTLFYVLTPQGRAGFDGYVAAIYDFARVAAASEGGPPANGAGPRGSEPDRRSDPPPPPARHAAAQPDPAAAE